MYSQTINTLLYNKTKRGDICSKMSQYGHGKGTVHGGCSEYSIVPEK